MTNFRVHFTIRPAYGDPVHTSMDVPAKTPEDAGRTVSRHYQGKAEISIKKIKVAHDPA